MGPEARRQDSLAIQIARKLDRIEPPVPSRWGALRLESLAENLANKMAALVGRGAPRDLLDVASLLRSRRVSREDCWRLWTAKPQQIAVEVARSTVAGHLAALDGRPLASIAEADLRQQAEAVRQTIRELCHGD